MNFKYTDVDGDEVHIDVNLHIQTIRNTDACGDDCVLDAVDFYALINALQQAYEYIQQQKEKT